MDDLLKLAARARIYDLAQPLFPGIPHFPTHPPFALSMTKQHGEYVLKNGGSSASELISMGGHTGTHIDALCHFSCNGKMYGGAEITQSPAGGVDQYSVDTIPPIVRRAVLFDIAGHLQVDALADDFAIEPEHLEAIAAARGIELFPGDVAFLRTGWGWYWDDRHQYVTAAKGVHVQAPGPEEPAARWLSSKGLFAVGSDTLAFERVPSSTMPVHVHLLVESGIHIIENLNLEELARDGVSEFLLIAAPLKIRGGTGSPLRPIGLVI